MRKILLGAAGLLGFLVVWQLIPTLGLVDPDYLPYATDVFGRLAQEVRDLAFWRRVRLTMTSWAIGLTVATLAAVALGTVVGMVPFLRRATHTTVEFLRPVPSVALIPLAVLMFGLQMSAALVIIVYAAFWQVFVQVIYGVADVDTVARDTARSFGLTRAERLRYLVLPTALPYLMTGLRLAAAVALILAVTAEMVIGNPGLGRMIELSRSAGDAVGLYGLVVVTGFLGLLVNVVFRFVERRSLAWHQSVLADEAAR
ncbi:MULTISPECIES: ABC transporter permease [unclassified Micromonospora]|uniref:ABC transporter permease n=1 Tax=unclassified Micromonospora TaxID=2617518 RepID=UPI001C211E46|nr:MULTISPECIES: ABC transporter permease [unclassified Micromonospora]MBU8860270.1 ABC transporter permease [Micromonospora sp. WMMB482]MDM4779803.1 ABC transporter permease [Micromonospora sp. b486]